MCVCVCFFFLVVEVMEGQKLLSKNMERKPMSEKRITWKVKVERMPAHHA